jgi:hypothetical protein
MVQWRVCGIGCRYASPLITSVTCEVVILHANPSCIKYIDMYNHATIYATAISPNRFTPPSPAESVHQSLSRVLAKRSEYWFPHAMGSAYLHTRWAPLLFRYTSLLANCDSRVCTDSQQPSVCRKISLTQKRLRKATISFTVARHAGK